MQLTVADYRDLIAAEGSALLAQLDRLTPEEWSHPSPCVGWDLLDVIVHLQLGTMVHTQMIESALAGRMEPTWNIPEGREPREYFKQVHQEAHDQGPAANLAQLRERLPGYDAALAQAADADLDKPAWFYGIPGATLRQPVAPPAGGGVHERPDRPRLGRPPAARAGAGLLAGRGAVRRAGHPGVPAAVHAG
jgi:hypothetical protein